MEDLSWVQEFLIRPRWSPYTCLGERRAVWLPSVGEGSSVHSTGGGREESQRVHPLRAGNPAAPTPSLDAALPPPEGPVCALMQERNVRCGFFL